MLILVGTQIWVAKQCNVHDPLLTSANLSPIRHLNDSLRSHCVQPQSGLLLCTSHLCSSSAFAIDGTNFCFFGSATTIPLSSQQMDTVLDEEVGQNLGAAKDIDSAGRAS